MGRDLGTRPKPPVDKKLGGGRAGHAPKPNAATEPVKPAAGPRPAAIRTLPPTIPAIPAKKARLESTQNTDRPSSATAKPDRRAHHPRYQASQDPGVPDPVQDFLAYVQGSVASKPAASVRIQNEWFTALVDTGNCFRSCISEEVFNRLPEHLRVLDQDPNITASSADSSPLEILGVLRHPLTFHFRGLKRGFHVNFYVLKNLNHDVNLGYGFLSHYGMIVDCRQQILRIGDHEVLLKGPGTEDITTNVLLAKSVELEPQEWTIVNGKTRNHFALQTGIVDASPLLYIKTGAALASGLLTCADKKGNVALAIHNPLGASVTLKEGTLLGTFQTAAVATMDEAVQGMVNHILTESKVRASNGTLSAGSVNAMKAKTKTAGHPARGESAKPAKPAVKQTREEIARRLKLDSMKAAVTDREKEQILDLCEEFQDIFSWDGHYGHTDLVTHHIPLKPGAVPCKDRYRPLNPVLEAELFKQVQAWLEQGIIRPCVSEWNSALVPVRKKSGEIRFCLDVRNLNERTVQDTTPIGDVNDLLSRLQKSKIFSTLDNVGAYLAVPIARSDQTKTAFATPWGTYCYTRMCFGLTTAPSSYARLVHKVLFELDQPGLGRLPRGVLPYLDDTILHTSDFEGHLALLRRTFEKFRKAELQLSPDKCELFRTQLKFLGHVVSEQGLNTCPEYKKVVMEWPIPNTRKAVRTFFGKVSYYRKFIRDFAKIARPLSDKLKDEGIGDNKVFKITDEFRQSFEELKQALLKAPILSHPDWSPEAEPFILDTDFSLEKMQAGATLSQVQDGRERVIAYGSIKLNPTQQGYDSYKGELVAMLIFAKKFKYFLQPRKFLFRTDCQALKTMHKGELKSPFRQWVDTLRKFKFEIIHRSRTAHTHVDALSKIDHGQVDDDNNDIDDTEEHLLCTIQNPTAEQLPSLAEQFRQSQESDEALKAVMELLSKGETPTEEQKHLASADLQYFFNNYDRLFLDKWGRLRMRKVLNGQPSPLRHPNLLVVPRDGYGPILRALHQELGHPGQTKMINALNRKFFVFSARKLIKLVAAQCLTCQRTSKRPAPQRGHYFPMAAGFPFQTLSIDFVMNLPELDGGIKHLFTVKDTFSRWFEAFPCSSCNSQTAIDKLTQEIFPRFSYCERIHCDNGSHFTSFQFRKFCSKLRIQLTFSPPYAAQSNTVERAHRDLKARLRSAVAEATANSRSRENWLTMLPRVLFILRTTTNRVTQMSPYEVLFGQAPSTQLSLLFKLPPTTRRELRDQAFRSMHETHEYARKNIAEFVRRKRCSYQGHLHRYEVGDRVWLFSAKPSTPNSRKLATYWTGPWTISRRINEVIYMLESDRRWARQGNPMVAIDRLMPYVGNAENEALHRAPGPNDDLSMSGDEHAEELRVPTRPAEEDEGSDAEEVPQALPAPGDLLPGPEVEEGEIRDNALDGSEPGGSSSDSSGSGADVHSQGGSEIGGQSSERSSQDGTSLTETEPEEGEADWTDPNSDDNLPLRAGEDTPSGPDEEEEEEDLERFVEEGQEDEHLQEPSEDEAEEVDRRTPPSSPEQGDRGRRGRSRESRVLREARGFVGPDFQPNRRRQRRLPRHLMDDFDLNAMAQEVDSLLMIRTIHRALAETNQYSLSALDHP